MRVKHPILRIESDFRKRVGQLGKEIGVENENTLFLVYDVIEMKNSLGELVWHYKYFLLRDGQYRCAPVWTFNGVTEWLGTDSL